MGKRREYIGYQNGDLTVIGYEDGLYVCQCACGNVCKMPVTKLIQTRMTHCGCWDNNEWTPEEVEKLIKLTKHGMSWGVIERELRHLEKYCREKYMEAGVQRGSGVLCAECKHYDADDYKRDWYGNRLGLCKITKERLQRCAWGCEQFERREENDGAEVYQQSGEGDHRVSCRMQGFPGGYTGGRKPHVAHVAKRLTNCKYVDRQGH